MSMMSPKGLAVAAVTLLVLFVIVMPSPVSAQKSLECQKVWEGPSISNDVIACLFNKDRIKDQWLHLLFPGISALLFLVTLLTFPILFLCVTCCQCSSCCKRREGDSTANSRCFVWMWIAYAILWSCGVVVLVIYGAKLLSVSLPALIDNTLDGPLNYFNETAEKIVDFTSNWTTGKREPLGGIKLDTEAFSNVSDIATNFLNNVRDDMQKYIGWVPIVSYSVGGVGVVLMFLMILLACCRCCVPCLPLSLSCVYWIFGVVYSLLGVVVILVAYLASVGCGEVQLQYQRQPGVFQWYLVPFCNEMFNFETINTEVRNTESTYSKNACESLLAVCDNTPKPLPPLTCGKDITKPDQCPDFGTMAEVMETTTVKAATFACPVPTESCSLAECAASCTNKELRAAAAALLAVAAQARNASIAVSYARPLLQCNFVVDELLGALDSCNDLKTGSLMLGMGFFVGGLMFGLAIYVMFRGSCVWRNPKW
ncbi:hypothetical protein LSM04_005086 [Trypanosoma melophagium]|uniref:uncharacterized protein n=1 Tax=Trypanosoma melophagium TaxID=715481 RepID=UPI003519E46D|nr:hypothetical protein LSM04_005086 [Trypanosoma melophagium]